MKGATLLATLQDLGITPSFSRPSVSNDNPYSESLFRTLKYIPEYPGRPFTDLPEARLWVQKFVDWYNRAHLLNVTLEITESNNLDDSICWQRQFDLILDLHEIPPRLGSGYWVSEDAPFQNLLIQQQSNTVVFYETTYNRTSGEPNWIYADGVFHGNSLNGVAYLVNWLSPVEGATQGFKNNPDLNPSIIPYNRLVQPEAKDLTFVPSSAGISVRGVNRIQAYVGLHEVDGSYSQIWCMAV